ncbi:hypothetical protein [Mesorhizobium loti]|uniref:hypothetical protein n=1 Tax=Rhizobium loti TaxID=381 RepID=UPI00041ABB13|nr:hypothetical protein [Mesorhizobium loti]
MAAKNPARTDTDLSDKEALEIAASTEVSPKQAKDLVAEDGKEKGKREAKKFKAEG